MPSDTPTRPRSFDDRRAHYRVTTVLPISIQHEMQTEEGELIERSVNLSGGGIGVTVNAQYKPKDVLLLTLLLPDQVLFKAYAEVLRLDHIITHHLHTYRLHARFIRMTARDQELLIRYIVRFQREHLQSHYSA